jgi:hypothetical protein
MHHRCRQADFFIPCRRCRQGVEKQVIEVDPRGDPAEAFGLGERPRRVGEWMLAAMTRKPD